MDWSGADELVQKRSYYSPFQSLSANTDAYVSALRDYFGFADDVILVGEPFKATKVDEPTQDEKLLKETYGLNVKDLVGYGSVVFGSPRDSESASYNIERAGYQVNRVSGCHSYLDLVCVVIRVLNPHEIRIFVYCHKN